MNDAPIRMMSHRRPLLAPLGLAVLLAAISLSCSVGQILVGRPEVDAPTPTRTARPTFTPLPGALMPLPTADPLIRGALPPGVTVQADGGNRLVDGTAEGSTRLLLYATDTPTPIPTSVRPSPTAASPNQPTPYVIVQADTLNGRRGPGTTFERIGQAARGDELMILARSADRTWWHVCCMANQPVWVSAELVMPMGAADGAPVATSQPTPAPTPLPTRRPPTATRPPAPTAAPPFDIARGPEFPMQRDDGLLTIWAKVYEGPYDNQQPLGGYILKVKRDGVDISDNTASFGDRPFDNTGKLQGNYNYNLKFELNGAVGSEYEIFLAKAGGFRVSPITTFTTKGDRSKNLVVFIAYWLAR